MSACVLGAKKQRQAERRIGLPLHEAFAWPSGLIEAVTVDDRHWLWDRGLDAVEEVLTENVCHWVTCPTVVKARQVSGG